MAAVDPPQGDRLGEGFERVGRSPMLTIAAGVLRIVIGVPDLVAGHRPAGDRRRSRRPWPFRPSSTLPAAAVTTP
jgi:hypothetical protein